MRYHCLPLLSWTSERAFLMMADSFPIIGTQTPRTMHTARFWYTRNSLAWPNHLNDHSIHQHTPLTCSKNRMDRIHPFLDVSLYHQRPRHQRFPPQLRRTVGPHERIRSEGGDQWTWDRGAMRQCLRIRRRTLLTRAPSI